MMGLRGQGMKFFVCPVHSVLTRPNQMRLIVAMYQCVKLVNFLYLIQCKSTAAVVNLVHRQRLVGLDIIKLAKPGKIVNLGCILTLHPPARLTECVKLVTMVLAQLAIMQKFALLGQFVDLAPICLPMERRQATLYVQIVMLAIGLTR